MSRSVMTPTRWPRSQTGNAPSACSDMRTATLTTSVSGVTETGCSLMTSRTFTYHSFFERHPILADRMGIGIRKNADLDESYRRAGARRRSQPA